MNIKDFILHNHDIIESVEFSYHVFIYKRVMRKSVHTNKKEYEWYCKPARSYESDYRLIGTYCGDVVKEEFLEKVYERYLRERKLERIN